MDVPAHIAAMRAGLNEIERIYSECCSRPDEAASEAAETAEILADSAEILSAGIESAIYARAGYVQLHSQSFDTEGQPKIYRCL